MSEANLVASAEAACATRGLGGSAPDQLFVLAAGESPLSIQTICWPTLKGSERTQPRKELTHIPSNLHTMQEQIKTLFAHVLDLDTSPKEPVQKKMVRYYNYRGDDQLKTFRFQPQPMSFEVIDRKTFTEVLYPKNIYDMIDYFVREFVKLEQPVRVCKNCNRYFALSGRSDTEYCNRSIDDKGRTCRDVGSIKAWTEKRKDDDVFKVYRREYKKRFGWIKAGKIEQDAFYAWSENTREKKAKCDAGEISFQEFQDWLRNS